MKLKKCNSVNNIKGGYYEKDYLHIASSNCRINWH